jgi:hypothetical protein
MSEVLSPEQIGVLIHLSIKAWDSVDWASHASIMVRKRQLETLEKQYNKLLKGKSLMDKMDPDHQYTRTKQENGQTKVVCSCGCAWTHSAQEDESKMDSIYESHLSYFKKPKIETL